jgi:hypothetical protein
MIWMCMYVQHGFPRTRGTFCLKPEDFAGGSIHKEKLRQVLRILLEYVGCLGGDMCVLVCV